MRKPAEMADLIRQKVESEGREVHFLDIKLPD